MAPLDSVPAEQRETAGPNPGVSTPTGPRRERDRGRRRRSAHGRLFLGVCALIIAAVVVIVAVHKGTRSNSGVSDRAPLPRPSAEIKLASPSGNKSAYGLAEVIRRGNNAAIAVVGNGLAPNSKRNAYAIWLYNSRTDAVRLGFVNPGVGRNGRLETAGGLPANAARFKELLVTIEITANPTSPGPVVLEGSATGL